MVLISALVIGAMLLGPHHALGAESGATECEGGSCPRGDSSVTMIQKGMAEGETSVSSPEEDEMAADGMEDSDDNAEVAEDGDVDVGDEEGKVVEVGLDQEDLEIAEAVEESKTLEGAVMIAGRIVYNYDKRGLQEGRGRVGENYTDWVVLMEDGTTDAQIREVCETIETDTGHPCLWEGHPDENGVAFLDFSGTKKELDAIVEKYSFIESTEPVLEVKAFDEGVRSWGLDRIDDLTAVGDSSYRPGLKADGNGVTVYVLDTGVYTDHEEFEGRAVNTLDMVTGKRWVCNGEEKCANDVHSHGTHCAGTVAGKTVGVARKASIGGVKVLSDEGSGYTSWITGALDWVGQYGKKPAVVSMSLGGSGRSVAYLKSIDSLTKNGIAVVVAAGNSNNDACKYSPAYVPSAITVGSTTKSSNKDQRSGFSNYGTCLDIYAPGSSIYSAGTSRGRFSAKSGTSMACPHVAGAAALVLSLDNKLTAKQVQTVLEAWSLKSKVSDAKSGSPNLMLYVGANIKQPGILLGGAPSPTPSPTDSRRRSTPLPTPSHRRRSTPSPTTNSPTIKYVDQGYGKCKGFKKARYSHGIGETKCKAKCTASPTCGAYAVSLWRNCLVFDGPAIQGKGPNWGWCKCMLKMPRPSSTSSPTPSPTGYPTPSPTGYPTPSPTEYSATTPEPPSYTTEPPSYTTEPPEEYTTEPPPGEESDFEGEFEGESGTVVVSQQADKTHIEYTGKNGTEMEMTVPGVYKLAHDDNDEGMMSHSALAPAA